MMRKDVSESSELFCISSTYISEYDPASDQSPHRMFLKCNGALLDFERRAKPYDKIIYQDYSCPLLGITIEFKSVSSSLHKSSFIL